MKLYMNNHLNSGSTETKPNCCCSVFSTCVWLFSLDSMGWHGCAFCLLLFFFCCCCFTHAGINEAKKTSAAISKRFYVHSAVHNRQKKITRLLLLQFFSNVLFLLLSFLFLFFSLSLCYFHCCYCVNDEFLAFCSNCYNFRWNRIDSSWKKINTAREAYAASKWLYEQITYDAYIKLTQSNTSTAWRVSYPRYLQKKK